MAGETELTIVGNLTADPELRSVSTGASVCNFTIAATPRTFNRQSGQWEDGQALFMRCTAWRELAEHISRSLAKGMRVIAHGVLSQETFQANDGTNRTIVKLTVDEIGPSLRYATAAVAKQPSARGFQGNKVIRVAKTGTRVAPRSVAPPGRRHPSQVRWSRPSAGLTTRGPPTLTRLPSDRTTSRNSKEETMGGLIDSVNRTISETCLWCHAHPGKWHAWPIAYSSERAAREDLERFQYNEVDGWRCDPRAFRYRRAHSTCLDSDGRYRVLVMLQWS